MKEWEEVRHQVAIAGCVTDSDTGQPLAETLVTMTDMPEEFKNKAEARALQVEHPGLKTASRIDQTKTSHDGQFYFLDLPKGRYALMASTPGRHPAVGSGKAKVEIDDKGKIVRATVNIHVKQQADNTTA